MKSTSARYLFPLFLSVGLPIACSGSTDKTTKPNDGKDYSEAGAAGSDGRNGSGGGSKGEEPGGHAGNTDDGGRPGIGGGPVAGSGGSGGTAAGAGPDGDVGGAGSAGESAGGAGEGGAGGGGVEPAIDPKLDGADDAASGRYHLHYKGVDKCLGAFDGQLYGATCAAGDTQAFFLDGAGAGSVRVRGVATDACVGNAGPNLGLVVCNEDASLQLVSLGFGFVQLKLTPELCLGLINEAPAILKCNTDTAWSLDALGTNYALKAKWTATSTFPGYSVDYAHDGDLNDGLSGHSWANNWQPPSVVLPQEVNVDLGAPKQFSVINVFTSKGYEIGSYDIDYWNGSAWINLAVVTNNINVLIRHDFPTVVAQKVRFVVRRGPELQFIYTRLNEVQIF
jgi:hypothetical protein